jgi:hypothetical protein
MRTFLRLAAVGLRFERAHLDTATLVIRSEDFKAGAGTARKAGISRIVPSPLPAGAPARKGLRALPQMVRLNKP